MYQPFKLHALLLLIFLVTGCSLVCPSTNTTKEDNVSSYYDHPSPISSSSSYSDYGYNSHANRGGSEQRQHTPSPTPEQAQRNSAQEAREKQIYYTVETNKAKVQYEVAKNQQEQKKREYEQHQQQLPRVLVKKNSPLMSSVSRRNGKISTRSQRIQTSMHPHFCFQSQILQCE